LWLHLTTSKLILSHIPWTLLRVPWRLFRMDTVYVIALFKALSNLGEVLRIRGDLKREQNSRSLEKIIQDIQPS
jgi:hypothetical protein